MAKKKQCNLISWPSLVVLQLLLVLVVALPATAATGFKANRKLIAANSGGSGILADSLVAMALTSTTNADFLELPLGLTRDDQLVVFDNYFLDPATDVAIRFPERKRDDGRYYLVDFTLEEVRQLIRIDPKQSTASAQLGIVSLKDALVVLNILERKRGKTIGIAPYILSPAQYREEGKEISRLTLQILVEFGYSSPGRAVLLQAADGDELQSLKKDLLPSMMLEFPLMQRIPAAQKNATVAGKLKSYDHTWMFTRLGLRMVSNYASGIGFHSSHLHDDQGNLLLSTHLSNISSLGMLLYVVPAESDNGLPEFVSSYSELLDFYFTKLNVDGIVTSSPQEAAEYLKQSQTNLQSQLQPAVSTPGTLSVPILPAIPVVPDDSVPQ